MRGSVAFPNDSWSYDATRLAVRFWGYDQSIEVPFFIGADVLGALQPTMAAAPDGCLSAFDANWARIRTVAAKVYGRPPQRLLRSSRQGFLGHDLGGGDRFGADRFSLEPRRELKEASHAERQPRNQ